MNEQERILIDTLQIAHNKQSVSEIVDSDDPFADLPLEQRSASIVKPLEEWQKPVMSAADHFKEPINEPKPFYERKHLFTHLMTTGEKVQLAKLMSTMKIQSKLNALCKTKLSPDASAIHSINDLIEIQRHKRLTSSSLFNENDVELDMIIDYLNICIHRSGYGWLCVRKNSDRTACFINSSDIRVYSAQTHAWYNCQNNSFYCKELRGIGAFEEDLVQLDVLNPFKGFVNVRAIVQSVLKSKTEFNKTLIYINSLTPVSKWEGR